ncbi:bridge-like lipid transfer protein family member 1 [Montipora capricornis]|uniref:bridge-like lipid transfer protein family member 1 n=1 Tax=Montipora capricornis TaxID=246305 RepID=UPI0035F14A2B
MANYDNVSTVMPSVPASNPTKAPEEGGLVFVVLSCLCASLWAIYITFYHSRLMGIILTRLIRLKYIEDGQYFKIGSFSFSILSGKIMFRDVAYVTQDLSVRIVDGIAIFKYWLPYNPEASKKPYQHLPSDVEVDAKQRLKFLLNGLEYHVYNRSHLYNKLEELFRVERYGDAAKSAQNIFAVSAEPKADVEKGKDEEANSGLPSWFLELVPSVKFDINNGRVAFGNKLLETTLCFKFECVTGIYTTSQANSSLDEFMHIVKCQGKNVRVILSPSPSYNGSTDEPPRYMGEGFVVVQTADCKITYYQDEPGFTPDVVAGNQGELPDNDPHWGIDVVFLKSTTLSYGPWVDRQRDALQKFFYPFDYQEIPTSKPLVAGQKRVHTGLDVKFVFECDATLDILFSKNRVTKAVHLCVGSASHIRVYQPWTVNDYGYTTSVVAKLFQVEASTSLAYRQLIEADVIELAFHMSFPRIWNQTQHWTCDITLSKVTWNFIFAHKFFFQEMIEDWTLNYKPDLLTFVPYEWSFNIILRDFEMVWLGNQHNWIECASNRQNNVELAFCGEVFDLTFVLQYFRFIPEIEEIKFFLQAEKVVARMFLPESNTLRRSFLSLARTAEKKRDQGMRSRSSTVIGNVDETLESSDEQPVTSTEEETISRGWRRHTDESLGWVDVMSVPILGLSLGYMYHPMYPSPKFEVPIGEPLPCDPTQWEPDVISLELEAGPAALRMFGSLLAMLADIKENYFGINQEFNELGVKRTNDEEAASESSLNSGKKDTINLQTLRPMEANIYLTLYDMKVELTKHCGPSEASSPLLFMERLSFEMHKTYTETRMQLHLTPATIVLSDGNERGNVNQNLSQGHLSLSGLQLRGHAMFSGLDRPPDCETLEYAWLVEIQLGILSGRLTMPQLQALGNWAQTFAFHVINKENDLVPSTPYVQCIHGKLQNECDRRHKKRKVPRDLNVPIGEANEVSSTKGTLEKVKTAGQLCLPESDVKYQMTRVSLERINLFLVETGCACNLEAHPIRLATCSLHSSESSSGTSFFLQTIKLRQFVCTPWSDKTPLILNGVRRPLSMVENSAWLEAAAVQLGPVVSDISCATSSPELHLEQKDFLEMHDSKYQRLWFLWQPHEKFPKKRHGVCGCTGGCNFFGKNVNGPRFFTPEKLDASENDTGIGEFGSEAGFYDDGDIVDSGARPLMYSRSADLDGLGSSYFDRTPVGSVEAFTRRRYHVSGSEGSSPKVRRARNAQMNEEALVDLCLDDDGSPEPSRLSWCDSLPRQSSSVSNVNDKMRQMPGSKQSLGRTRQHSTSQSPHGTLERPTSHFSRGSEASFYSCGSFLDELDMGRSRRSRINSAESFVSAVQDPDDLIKFEEDLLSPSHFVIASPSLVSRYSQHLGQLECLNWNSPLMIPSERRQFSIIKNLKEMEPEEEFTLPGVPQFTYQGASKIEFPLLLKRTQKRTADHEEWNEDEETSSSHSENGYSSNVTVKAASPARDTQGESKNEDASSGFLDSERDSARKTRWNSMINQEDSSSSSGECSPISTLRKSKKSRNEATMLLRCDGEINILVTPLLLEALQRYLSSISRQDSILHPALVVDLVHDKCVDATENLYNRHCVEYLPEVTSAAVSRIPASQEPKEKQMVVFFSTAKINFCILQVAGVADSEIPPSPDSVIDEDKPHSVSLLAGWVSGVTAEVLSVRRKLAQEDLVMQKKESAVFVPDVLTINNKKQKDKTTVVLSPVNEATTLPLKKSRRHRNTMTTASATCAQIHFQLCKLCDKDDIEHCVTTAIPEESSRCKFQVNNSSYVSFTESFETHLLNRGDNVNLLMLECGLDNVRFKAGSECASGSEVLPKIRERRRASGFQGEVGQSSLTENKTEAHGYTNPIFDKELSSQGVRSNPQERDRKSIDSLSSASSLSSSHRSLSSSSGNDSDKESDADDDVTKPLLRSGDKQEKETALETVKPKEVPSRDAELARRSDVTLNFTNIWFNLASPSSFKTVPANYHLYNSIVTTVVPFVTAWVQPVTQLRQVIAAMESNHQRFLNIVFGCLLAQALPENGRIPKAHTVSASSTEKSKFLQEDHSSQLIYILRRQLTGSKLNKIKHSLAQKASIPEDEDLVKGIFALARQWKCFLAGTEEGEVAFYGSSSLKRRVVGRGVLTQRDRAILLREERASRQEDTALNLNVAGFKEPIKEVVAIDTDRTQEQVDETPRDAPTKTAKDALALELEPLVSKPPTEPVHLDIPRQRREIPQESDTDSDDSPPATIRKPHKGTTFAEGKKLGHHKQLSLYSWLSSPPTASPPSSQSKTVAEGDLGRKTAEQPKDSVSKPVSPEEPGLFSDMVSVPTSGKQIKDERETFKNFLQAINLMPRVAKQQDTASTFSVSTRLRYLHVHQVDGGFDNLGKKGKGMGMNQVELEDKRKKRRQERGPVFIARDFVVRFLLDESPIDIASTKTPSSPLDEDTSKLTQIKFTVGCSNITQRVNLPFVRLTLQVVDMLDLLSQFISNGSGSEMSSPSHDPARSMRPRDQTDGVQRFRTKSSRGHVKCWRVMYQIVDLYSSLPREAKNKGFLKRNTVGRGSAGERGSPDKPREVIIDIEDGLVEDGKRRRGQSPSSIDKRRSMASRSTTEATTITDHEDAQSVVPLHTVFGVVTLPRVKFLASIGGLVLETEVREMSVSFSRNEEKEQGHQGGVKSSITAHLGKTKVDLKEASKFVSGTVVSCSLSRSHVLFSSVTQNTEEKGNALVTLGIVDIDIPQHPVALHSMMTRSSRTISRHISEIQTQRSVIRSMASLHDSTQSRMMSHRLSAVPSEVSRFSQLLSPSTVKQLTAWDRVDGSTPVSTVSRISFTCVLRGFTLGASLLPSLRAEYKMGRIAGAGRTGKNSNFKLSMPVHSLSFTSKVQSLEVTIPPATVVELPPVSVQGELISKPPRPAGARSGLDETDEGRRRFSSSKRHLYISTEVGAFQHSLTTDLLNHLVFVQKSFMKEVNDVLQRVSGESQPVPLWRTVSTEDLDTVKEKEVPLLYSLRLNLKGIQVTATTPSSTAVRLDTGVVALEVSNSPSSTLLSGHLRRSSSYVKLFGKAQVDVNLSLGQFTKSRNIDNEFDFQQMAYFKTTIGISNSYQDTRSLVGTEDKETFLVTLTQPRLYVQQVAFDKAVLVYLNYKNAYEHWNEQRLALNKEVHFATQAVLDKLPQRPPSSQLSGSLFLQLTVDQLGVCIPLYNAGNQVVGQSFQMRYTEQEPGPAMVLRVEHMLLTCCSSISFVSKGKFSNFCLWFEDKFDPDTEEWKPEFESDPVRTRCSRFVVPEGTYELCSRTQRYPVTPDMIKAGKWVMSFQWRMCGIELHCDTSIGKHLSSLGQTLTALTGDPDVANIDSVTELQDRDPSIDTGELGRDEVDNKGAKDKRNTRNIEKNMWEQARRVNELR